MDEVSEALNVEDEDLLDKATREKEIKKRDNFLNILKKEDKNEDDS